MADENADNESLRRRSKRLLGSGLRVEVGAAIGRERGAVWGSGLIEALGLEEEMKGPISRELSRLQEAGLIVKGADNRHERRAMFEPDRGSSYWALCEELLRRWTADQKPGN